MTAAAGLHRHRSSILVLGMLLACLVAQWPAPARADDDSQEHSESPRRHKRKGKGKHRKRRVEVEGSLQPTTPSPSPAPSPAPAARVSDPTAPQAPPAPVSPPTPVTPKPAPFVEPTLEPEPEPPPSMFADFDRPVNHWILRIDFGVGGGTDGLQARLSPGIETRLIPDWGIGLAVAGFLAGAVVPRTTAELNVDLRTFFDFGLSRGWLRAQLSGGPLLYSKSANLCITPLCGYVPAVSSDVGVYGAFEIGYWLARGPGTIGGALRVQYDSTNSIAFLLNIGFAGDLSAPSGSWRR